MNDQTRTPLVIALTSWVVLGGCWPIIEDAHTAVPNIPRDAQVVGSTASNSSIISHRTATLSKEINTALAASIFLLTAVTYWILMAKTTALSSQVALPSESLEQNVGAMLSLVWPKTYTSVLDQRSYGKLVLFHIVGPRSDLRMSANAPSFVYRLAYHGEFKGMDRPREGKPFLVNVKTFSPVMRSLVQIGVWNSISLFLVVVMVFNTLVYNGFLSNNITDDSILRLVLVTAYALANIGTQYAVAILLYRNLNFAIYQTCWTLICKMFVFLHVDEYRHYRMFLKDNTGHRGLVWTKFESELFGTTASVQTYQVLQPSDEIHNLPDSAGGVWAPDDKRRDFHVKEMPQNESSFDKLMKTVRDTELKIYEKATESTLDKVLANVAVSLGVCLATALAPWTSTHKADATSAQLGSYALLLSVSTGLLALVGILTQLTNATESARTLLKLQERTLLLHEETPWSVGTSERVLVDRPLDPTFSNSVIPGQSELTWSGLWRFRSLPQKLCWLVFGSYLSLVPDFHSWLPSRENSYLTLFMKVQDVTLGIRARWNVFGDMVEQLYGETLLNAETHQGQGYSSDERPQSDQGIIEERSDNSRANGAVLGSTADA